MEQDFVYQLSTVIIIVLLSVAAFGACILSLALITQTVGKMVFGQRFEDWWDRTFWF